MPLSEVYNMDCMEYMRQFPDKHFELAVVDPPYGLGQKIVSGFFRGSKFEAGSNVDWDSPPSAEYFLELFRVSKNQVVWGANYFLEHFGKTRCVIIWDKVQEFSGADFEMAWTSFDLPAKSFKMSRVQAYTNGKTHICQKPVALYKWIFENYAQPGWKILDTHLGSGSSRIAAWDMGLDFYATELDPDYFEAMEKRFQAHIARPQLFAPAEQYQFKQASIFDPENL